MNRIIKLSLLLFLLSLVACKNKISSEIENSNVEYNLYFHRNYYCFDFVKKCELEVLQIKNKDTLIYVNHSQSHGRYEELQGILSRINDSIFHVKPFKYIQQSGNKSKPFEINQDSLYFYCDSFLVGTNLTIEYSNNIIDEFEIKSTRNVYYIRRDQFKSKKDRLYFTLSYQNPIVDELVEISSLYSNPKYNVIFEEIQNSKEFYIVLTNEKVFTLNSATQDRHNLGVKFNLLKMEKDFKFKNGRELN